jgi:Mannosyltransferase (PIG-V)
MPAVPASSSPPDAWTDDDTRAVSRLMLAVVAIRVATACVAFLVNVTFPLARPEQFTMLGDTHYFWDTFVRNDSGWYYGIASRGYEWVAGGRNNLAFFPAYPLLMRVAGRLFGASQADYYYGGIVVSWVASVGAAGFVYGVARQLVDRERAWHATLLTFVFPFAFFFGAVYSEALFVLGLSAALFALHTRRWGVAVVAGAVMTATRVNGIMAVPALAWIGWKSARAGGLAPWRGAAAGALASLGFLGYCAYNWQLAGDPFEWYAAITRWGYQPGTTVASNPLVAFVVSLSTRPYAYLVDEHAAPYDVLNGLFPLLMVASLPGIWRRLGFGYTLLVGVSLALPLSSGQFEGLGRYCAVLFPFQIWVAAAMSEAWRPLVYVGYGVLYALALTMFTTLHSIF